MSKIVDMTGEAGNITRAIVSNMASTPTEGANDFICTAWGIYLAEHEQTPSITGKIFEYLIAQTLISFDISPLYYQAQFHFVPNSDFDFVLYDPKRPIILTLKTTLRERYKQADLEGVALKQVYRNASCILITLSPEGEGVRRKIASLDVTGLNQVVIIEKGRNELDLLITELKRHNFTDPQEITPMKASYVFGNKS